MITTRLREGVSGVFFEDEVMLEAQQRGHRGQPGYDFYNLNIDAGSMWTRRIVQRMIEAEAGTDVAEAPETAGERGGGDGRGDGRGERAPGPRTATPVRAPRSRAVSPSTASSPAAGLMGRGL